MMFVISAIALGLAVYIYMRQRDIIFGGSSEDLYTEEEIQNGVTKFRAWFQTHVEPNVKLGQLEYSLHGSALYELQTNVDVDFAIMISKMCGREIVKTVTCDGHTTYSIKLKS